ncbi:MAG: FAD-dependent oxidoreductase [Candidatus Tyrphobacter sp.]
MDAPVIIVGGGPVGLSLGLGLAHHGVRSTILEREAEPPQESRALLVVPRTLEVMQDWSALDALRAAGTWRQVVEISAVGVAERIVRIDFSNVADVIEPAGALLIPQNETESVLRGLVGKSGLCTLRTRCDVTAVEERADGVSVTFSTDAGTQQMTAGYVVGCDGAHSIVRQALGLALEGTTYRARAVLTDVIVSGPPWAPPSPRFSFKKASLALGIEYAANRWRVIALLPEGVDDASALDPAEHAARLARLLGEGVRARTIWSSLFRIHRRHAQHFVVGSIALAGDAAHLNSPAGGQGMNAGIHDAANLAWKLAYAFSGRSDAQALLSSYELERREAIAGSVERFTDALTRFGFGGARWLGALPFRLLGFFLREPGMQRKACRAMGMLSGRYTKSPLIDTRHPLAGRRIDDLALPNGSRINRMRAGGAALVVVGHVFGDGLPEPVIRIEKAPKHWHLKHDAALVVRPDGCVACVVERPTQERVSAAWRKAFALRS